MKKIILLFTLTLSLSALSQSKTELMNELYAYSKNIVMNKSYDKSFQEVWDAVNVACAPEYSGIRRESKDKGYIEYYYESHAYKESLTVDIVGSGPYKVVFTIDRQTRKNPDGSIGSWRNAGAISEHYRYKLLYNIYSALYGSHTWPEELAERVAAYNQTQKKDKHKILKGRDY